MTLAEEDRSGQGDFHLPSLGHNKGSVGRKKAARGRKQGKREPVRQAWSWGRREEGQDPWEQEGDQLQRKFFPGDTMPGNNKQA